MEPSLSEPTNSTPTKRGRGRPRVNHPPEFLRERTVQNTRKYRATHTPTLEQIERNRARTRENMKRLYWARKLASQSTPPT